jgi:hypothetical protein
MSHKLVAIIVIESEDRILDPRCILDAVATDRSRVREAVVSHLGSRPPESVIALMPEREARIMLSAYEMEAAGYAPPPSGRSARKRLH